MALSDLLACNRLAMLDWQWFSYFGRSRQLVLEKLVELGFDIVEADLEVVSQELVGTGCFERRADKACAPAAVDCSSFTQYVFSRVGVSIPRLAVDQRLYGEPILQSDASPGDLLFASGKEGKYEYYDASPQDAVGHVGLLTSRGTVIHAYPPDPDNHVYIPGIHEEDLPKFFSGRKERGACRILPPVQDRLVVRIPENREITFTREIVRLVSTVIWKTSSAAKTPVSS